MDSASQFASFFTQGNSVTKEGIEELKALIEKKKLKNR